MWEKIKTTVEGSKVIQFVLVLLLGIAIGAIFYPTKKIEERERQKHELETKTLNEQHTKELSQARDVLDKVTSEYKYKLTETEKKVTKLTTENTTLKTSNKTAYYKIVRPDGTIEIKKFTETQVDESKQIITSIQEEFKQKVASIEAKWESVHKERVQALQKEFSSKEQTYKHQIDELEKSKVVEINKKSFGIEAGLLTSGNYYGHVTYDLFGPIFLGLHSQFGGSTSGGAGLGLRF
jgi:hypothetical protein